MRSTALRKKIRNNELTLGSWITIGHPAIPSILAGVGFEWLVIDIEHTTIDYSMVQILISETQANGMSALIRISKNEEVVIKRVLDAGADGIIVPMVCSEDDAIQAVKYAKYPPEGKRGVGLARAQQYGYDFESYKYWVKEGLIVIAQIEHIDGIRNLEKIVRVPGIDGTIIGPYDLSGSLGILGCFDDPRLEEYLDIYKKNCVDNKVSMGYHVVNSDPLQIEKKILEGYHFIAYGTDFLFMGDSCRRGMNKLGM